MGKPQWLQYVMDLSTAHMPYAEALDDLDEDRIPRVVPHKHGFIVFVAGIDDARDAQEADLFRIPDWLQPIYEAAVDGDVLLINFDKDAEVANEFESWEW